MNREQFDFRKDVKEALRLRPGWNAKRREEALARFDRASRMLDQHVPCTTVYNVSDEVGQLHGCVAAFMQCLLKLRLAYGGAELDGVAFDHSIGIILCLKQIRQTSKSETELRNEIKRLAAESMRGHFGQSILHEVAKRRGKPTRTCLGYAPAIVRCPHPKPEISRRNIAYGYYGHKPYWA